MINQKPDRPDLLDLNKTHQIRQKHANLQNTIQSTIQGLLQLYRNKNIETGTQQRKEIKNQVFDRLALVFSQMNEFKGQIDQTISYLNEGGSVSSYPRQVTSNKKKKVRQERMAQVQQYGQNNQMQQQQQQQKEKQKQQVNQNQQGVQLFNKREIDNNNKMESQKC